MLALKNNCVFVHIPKTGGRFVRQTLNKLHVVDGKYGGMHCGVKTLNEVHYDARKVATMRNPWAWYVSLYFFNKTLIDKKRFTRDHVIDINNFEEFMTEMLVHRRCRIGMFLSRNKRDSASVGALTRNMKHQCYKDGEDWIDYYLKLEDIKENFAEAFQLDQLHKDKLEAQIDMDKKVGATQHKPFKEYYTQELIDLVAEKESVIIDKFGYTF